MDKKYLLINMAVAGVFGVVTGKLVGYYNGKYEGALAKIEELAKEMAEKDEAMADYNSLREACWDYTNRLMETEKKHEATLKELISLKEETKDFLREKKEKEQKEQKEKEVKQAIKEKKWDVVYKLTERWYNHCPVQMSRAEVFTNLKKDGYIAQEECTEAHDYFGNLWFYVGD